MFAAVTTAARELVLREVPDPVPEDGHVVIRPLSVGICGSDLHLFAGDTGALSGAERGLPRIQGHEIAAEVLLDPSGRLVPGTRVAVWPLLTCGTCRLCRAGTVNACPSLQVIGIHRDGGLAGALAVPSSNVVAVGDVDPVVAALVEPLSVAVHAVARARARPGDRAVVIGGGAVGQGVCLALADAGVTGVLLDPSPARASAAALWGFDGSTTTDAAEVRGLVAARTGGEGADLVVDATGVPAVLDTALDVVRAAGTVVAVGLTSAAGPVHTGLLAAKELTVLGSSCCTGAEFGAAAALARRWSGALSRLPVRRFPLAEAGAAIGGAHPEDVVKVVIDVDHTIGGTP